MITNITDRERTQAAVILALESARDEMSARIEALTAELAESRLQYVATFGQEQERGWQPIETAPTDGSPFLVYLAEEQLSSRIHAATFHPNVKCIGGLFAFDAPKPTHWMPLPTPPAPIWDQLADIGASDPQAWEKS